MRRKIGFLMALALMLACVFGCAPVNSEENSPKASENSGEQRTLVVANWKGYGSDSEYAVSEFEKANNCKVVHQYYDSLEQLLTMLRQGGTEGIDVILANMAYVKMASDQDLIKEADVSQLANYGDLMDSAKEAEDVKTADGKVYGVPWLWGTTSLAYNGEKVSEAPASWKALWDPANKGKVTMFDDHITAVLIGAMYAGEEDPYNCDLAKVENALMALKDNCKLYWSSYDSFVKPYSTGEITMGPLWSGAATQMNAEGTPVEYVYPEEGVVAWVDYWCLTKGTKQDDLAYKWIDWMTSEDFQAYYTSDLKSQPPAPANLKVADSMTEEGKKALYIDKLPQKMYYQKAMPEEQNQKWLDLWNKVKAS